MEAEAPPVKQGRIPISQAAPNIVPSKTRKKISHLPPPPVLSYRTKTPDGSSQTQQLAVGCVLGEVGLSVAVWKLICVGRFCTSLQCTRFRNWWRVCFEGGTEVVSSSTEGQVQADEWDFHTSITLPSISCKVWSCFCRHPQCVHAIRTLLKQGRTTPPLWNSVQ